MILRPVKHFRARCEVDDLMTLKSWLCRVSLSDFYTKMFMAKFQGAFNASKP